MASRGKIGHLWLFQFAADFGSVVAAYYTAYYLRFHSAAGAVFYTAVNRFLQVRETGLLGPHFEHFYAVSAPRIILLLTLTLGTFYVLRDLYPGRRFLRRRPTAWNVILANVMAMALFYVYFYMRRNAFHPRSFFVTVLFFNVLYCLAFRAGTDALLRRVRRRFGVDRYRGLLIGSGRDAAFVERLVQRQHPHGIEIAEQTDYDFARPIDAESERVRRLCRTADIDLIICADRRFSVPDIMRLLELGAELDAPVKVLSSELNILVTQARMPTDMIHGYPLIHFQPPSAAAEFGRLRERSGIALAWVMLVLLAPLMGIVALAIRLTSSGPVLFRQERIGVNRRPFVMFKFRTMYQRADELQAQVEEFNESGAALFKMERDPRVTPVGRILRRCSLDELPQLVNVIRGEMCLVGPRPLPERDFGHYYEEWHYTRHSGKPGLTCLWQVSGRSELDFHNMCLLDVFYLSNQSWVLDFKILLRTVWVVLFAKGAA